MKEKEMHNWQISNIPAQDEESMLEQLGINVIQALDTANILHEAAIVNSHIDYEQPYMYIVVNDEIHKILLGGPQAAALNMFIDHIAKENGYSI